MLTFILSIEDDCERTWLEKIYKAYADTMYYRAYRILQNKADAEDAVHSSFVKLLENLGKLEAPICDKTRSFVLIVVENTAIDIYRKRKRTTEQTLHDDTLEAYNNYNYIGTNRITSFIFELPEKYRNILLLKYIHGYTYSEIADIMDITTENAKKLGQRAKTKLEEKCRKENIL